MRELDRYKAFKDYHWQQYYGKKPNTVYQKHVNRVVDFFKDKKGKLLDVGSGDGLILNELSKNKNLDCFGIDISQEGVRIAKEKGVVNCKAIDLFSFNESGYDYIYLGDVLEHLPDPKMGLKKVKVFLKLGGIIFIAVPIQSKKEWGDLHLFTKQSAFKLISEVFEILSVEERLKKWYFVVRK